MKTSLSLEYTAEDIARLILADMIRKNPILTKLTNEQYQELWANLLAQTGGCYVELPIITQTDSGYDIKTGKRLSCN